MKIKSLIAFLSIAALCMTGCASSENSSSPESNTDQTDNTIEIFQETKSADLTEAFLAAVEKEGMTIDSEESEDGNTVYIVSKDGDSIAVGLFTFTDKNIAISAWEDFQDEVGDDYHIQTQTSEQAGAVNIYRNPDLDVYTLFAINGDDSAIYIFSLVTNATLPMAKAILSGLGYTDL